MGWNGSGTFNRIFSWVADKAAGLDIIASRMDTDTNDIASAGFGNCLTRDGQGQPTANLPMAGFRHTGVQNAVIRSDYSAFGQVQDGLSNWTISAGGADAITATYTPALTTLNDGQLCFFRASAANATTTPTFSPNSLTAELITKSGGAALVAGDIPGDFAECILRYNLANTRWELLNPATPETNPGTPTTGDVKFTFKTTADPNWLMFDDGTYGSASSGSSNSNSAANQALFTLMFNGISDTNAPLFTSTGAATTRAAQGTAVAAWAANCRMSLPKTLGRALGVAGAGSGLTSRALAQAVGAETVLIAQSGLPNVAPTFTGGSDNVSQPIPATSISVRNDLAQAGTFSNSGTVTGTVTPTGTISSINGGVTQTATSIMQATSFLNAMIKQ
ncbi:hypothetical protein [Bradyrhizobium sp.]